MSRIPFLSTLLPLFLAWSGYAVSGEDPLASGPCSRPMNQPVVGRCCCTALILGLSGSSALPGSWAGNFQQACQVYGLGNFKQAAILFQEIAEATPSAGTLHNLGNAQWQCGRVGEAILAWERARWLEPYDANPRTNLRYARKVAQLDAPELAWYEICSTWLPVDAWAWLAAGSFWLAIFMLLLPGIFRWRKADWHQGLAAIGFAVFLLTLPALMGVHTRSQMGVIVTSQIPLRLTPTREAQTLTKLAAGEVTRLERVRGSYAYVRTGNDAAGWVERSQFGLICDRPAKRSGNSGINH